MSFVFQDSAWPLLLLGPMFALILGRLLYAEISRWRGRTLPVDQDLSARGHSLILGQAVRQAYAWSVAPVARALAGTGVGPHVLTMGCLVSSLAGAVLIASGAVTHGGVIGLFGASLDYFDGRVARLTGRATQSGEFLDSTLDRWGEIGLLSGAAFLFRDSNGVLVASLVAMGSGGIVSYTRAKAESLGFALTAGLMQRSERLVLFHLGACLGTALEFVLPPSLQGQRLIFAGTLYLLALLTTVTAIARTVRGFAALRRFEGERTDRR
jgi:phosphatidylglycerophosphate synthase